MGRVALAFFVLVFSALVGCAPECASAPRPAAPYDVYPKPDQDQAVIDDMRESVAAWNERLRPILGFDVFVFHAEGAPDPYACGAIVVGFGGFVHPGAQATTDLRDRCHMSVNLSPNGFWNTTIVHELGHTLGLRDIAFDPEAEGVQRIMMQGTLEREILPADVESVASESEACGG